MNKDIIEGKWNEVKGKLKQQWADLNDNDIGRLKGTRQELGGLLQKQYGYDKDRAEKEIDAFIDKNKWNS
jgi:uncharacterized protein YjbJ (UPF0337 family)